MTLRMLYLIFVRLAGWMVLLARSLLVISVTLRVLWFYAAEDRRLLAGDVSGEQAASRNTTLTPVLAVYLAAVVLGLLVPQAAVAVLALAVIYLATPGRAIYRLLPGRHPRPGS